MHIYITYDTLLVYLGELMKISVTHKKEFGKDRFYPECEQSKLVLWLMKRNSFTLQQIKRCKNTGWEVEVKTQTIEI